MSLRDISNTSIILSLFRNFYRWYSFREQKLVSVYHDSKTCRLTRGFYGGVKVCFRYSFLGRITETEQTSSGVLDKSRTVQNLINLYLRWKDKIIRSLKASSTIKLAKGTKKELYFSPMKIISIIIITAITINIFLSIVLQKQIGLWGWLMRGLFLLAAVLSLFCTKDWSTVKKSSIILKKMGPK